MTRTVISAPRPRSGSTRAVADASLARSDLAAGCTRTAIPDPLPQFCLPPGALPAEGFVRLNQILAPRGPLPISRAAWWAGVATGRFPKPVKLGPRTTAWRVADLRALIAEISQ